MSHPTYIASHVEIKEFICILKVVRSAIFDVTFPGYSILPPPTASHTLVGYSFCGRTSTTIREYVTMLTTIILLRATKRIVFVPFLIFLAIQLQFFQIILIICSANDI